MKHFVNILSCILPMLTFGQLQDDFSDGNFTANPAWSGTTANFIVNTSKQLQTTGSAAATSYLSTPHNLSSLGNKEWDLYVKLSFAGSTSNFARIYLTADNADLTMNPDGYYLQLGESLTTDAIRLFRQESGTSTEICAGTTGAIANATNAGIRVVRDASGNWSLYADYTGGTNYAFQSSGIDASSLTGTHMGFLCTYTASNATKFYFDNVYCGNEILDTQAPTLLSASAINASNIDLLFSEAIQQASGETPSNYVLDPANTVISATRDPNNWSLIHLALANAMQNGVSNTVTATNVADLAGNTSVQSATCMLLISDVPAKGDVVINEFMCDPSPVIGLPELEYVEIYNRSNKLFHLAGWQLGDNASSGTIADAWLLPGEHKILCGTSSVDSFPGAVAVTSFPSLNNSGDDIVLKDAGGVIIDKITYSDQWYMDENKKEGGYALELINPDDPCSDASNWRASDHLSGGTPGTQNSVYDDTPDTQMPQITEILASAPNLLTVRFSEGMDSTSVMNAVLQSDPALSVSEILLENPFSPVVVYAFQENLAFSQVYPFTLTNIADCWLNQTTLSGQFVLPDSARTGDLVINEILFNPITSGYDFVEVRNNSQKMIDLYGLSIANYEDGGIDNIKPITNHFLLAPEGYAVFTADTTILKQTYASAMPGCLIQMTLPALNNDSGTVYLLNALSVVDRVSYLEKWHFRLLDDFDGKSIEKIDPEGNSNDPGNWHSAAEAIGFATPGKQNSQYSAAAESGNFSLTNDTFSPDNDGHEDVLQLNYQMNQPGMVGSVTIFDDRGRQVRKLVRSELLSTTGSLSWDGITDDNQKASIGTYVLIFEAFNAGNGDLFAQRKAFVLAGKL